MQKVRLKKLPLCDICSQFPGPRNKAKYDAQIKGSTTWGYMCEDCARTHAAWNQKEDCPAVGTQLVGGIAEPKEKIVLGEEAGTPEYWETVMMDGVREIECPKCNEIRRMEPDADGSIFNCAGCGIRVQVPGGLF